MSIPQSEVQALINVIQSVRATTYGSVAACAFLLYDVALTMAREIKYIWSNQNWSFPKLAYIFLRYYGIAYLAVTTTISISTTNSVECRRYFGYLSMGGPIIFLTLSNVILLLRLYALYSRDRKILMFLIFLVGGQFAADLYAAIRITIDDVNNVIEPPLGLPWPGCVISRFNTEFTLISWIPLLVVATIFFLMTLANFFRMAFANRRISRRRLSDIWQISPLLTAFVRDGTVYYLILLITILIAMTLSAFVQGPIALAANSWLVAMYSFATSRLLLNLREFADKSGSVVAWEQTLSLRIRPNISEDDEETLGWQLESL